MGARVNASFSRMTPDESQIVVFTPAMRTLIADAIESLILLLDEIDGDGELGESADFEAEPDMEPSLGAADNVDQSIAWQATIGETDAEQEHDGPEPEADFEPRFVPAFEAG
jgi:hypothetical protein